MTTPPRETVMQLDPVTSLYVRVNEITLRRDARRPAPEHVSQLEREYLSKGEAILAEMLKRVDPADVFAAAK